MNTVATGPRNRRRIIAQTAIARASAKHGVSADDILGKSRVAKIAAARQDAQHHMWALGVPEARIAELFGADRSTVNHNTHTAALRLIERN